MRKLCNFYIYSYPNIQYPIVLYLHTYMRREQRLKRPVVEAQRLVWNSRFYEHCHLRPNGTCQRPYHGTINLCSYPRKT